MLSTDSPEILELGIGLGLSNNGLRPAALSGDHASSIDVALHELEQCLARGEQYDLVAYLQPTSPFRLAERWEEAFRYVADGSARAVVSVTRAAVPPEHYLRRADDGLTTPLIPDGLTKRTQDIEAGYFINGALYLIDTTALMEARSFYPAPLKSVICSDPRESIDLDTEEDWREAELMLTPAGR